MRTGKSVEISFTAIDGSGADFKTFKNLEYAKAFIEKRLGGCMKYDSQSNQITGGGWKASIVYGATIADLIPNLNKENQMIEEVKNTEKKNSDTPTTEAKAKASFNMPQRISRILNCRHSQGMTAAAIATKEGVSTARINHLLVTAERAACLALIKEHGLEESLKLMMVDFEIDAHDTVVMTPPKPEKKTPAKKPAKAKDSDTSAKGKGKGKG